MRRAMIGVFLTLSMLGGGHVAHADDADTTATAVTVWVGGKGKDSMADKISELHAEMGAKGWRFADLDLYMENEDMQGVFVTYVRDAVPVAAPVRDAVPVAAP